jgi:hypothetical protein
MVGTILKDCKQHLTTAHDGRVADSSRKREISAAKRAAA